MRFFCPGRARRTLLFRRYSRLRHDLFDAAYLEGVTEEIAPPQESGHELMPRAALAEAFALEGCVLTPERAIEKGYVVVGADRTIASVSEAKPQGVPVHRTDGVICPGLIDLHGHPEFNIFAAWEPPREFVNRYAWRGSDLYKELVREPQNKLLGALPPKTQLRYAEIRALVGGVTAIQGTGGQATSYQDEALVRNVDKWIFGEQRARSMIDLPSGSRGRPELESILAGIESGKVRAFYIHLAEGRSDNERSREELDTLVELGRPDRAHGDHPRHRAERGAAGRREGRGGFAGVVAAVEPAPVRGDHEGGGGAAAEACRWGWARTGCPRAAPACWRSSRWRGVRCRSRGAIRARSGWWRWSRPTPRRSPAWRTSSAASSEGRPADLVVFERREADPWENVARADPAWVELVMVDGDLAYGSEPRMRELADPQGLEGVDRVIAWGKPMLLDTSYRAAADDDDEPPPSLTALREALIGEYPQVGPIFS